MRALTATVVGGGVLAATLGVLLRIRGIPARLVTAQRADRVDPAGASPDFASLYPAASVLPHSVRLAGAEEVLGASLAAFAAFAHRVPEIVRRQWHYEIFESAVPDAAYLSLLRDVEPLSSDSGSGCPLQRSPDVPVSGWRLRGFFVEAPEYLEMLFRLFEVLGGTVETRRLRGPEDLRSLSGGDYLFVCAGMGTPILLGRQEERQFEEGRLLHLPIGLSELPSGPASYNYTPEASVHPGLGGAAMDVYAYPRRGSLVLGGTRLPGIATPEGVLTMGSYAGQTIPLPDARGGEVLVPAAILRLNRILLAQLLALDITGVPATACIGRRYRGPSPEAGVTITSETPVDRPLVACYGLGGGGVTLSWGLAARLLLRFPGCSERFGSISGVLTPAVMTRLAAAAAGFANRAPGSSPRADR